MSQLKKIDYRQLSKESFPQTEQTQSSTETSEPKMSFFSALATKWNFMDKKIKVEAGLFVIIILLIIVSMTYYFSKSRASKIEFPPRDFSLPEENEPPNTAPEYEYLVPEL